MMIFIVPFVLFSAIIPAWVSGSFKTEPFLITRAFIVLLNIFWFFNVFVNYSTQKYTETSASLRTVILTLTLMFFTVI
jgi:hypothetical protein